MNRTKPHRGGVPKGRSWTKMAAEAAHLATQFNPKAGRSERYRWIRRALEIIRDHSRSAATRAEARRLLNEAWRVGDPLGYQLAQITRKGLIRLPLAMSNPVHFNWGDYCK